MNTQQDRYDIYQIIHKGLRAFLAQTLVDTGRTDWADAERRQAQLAQLRALLDLCEHHVENEDHHLHPAMEAVRPGSSGQTAGDHLDHGHHIEALRSRLRQIEGAVNGERERLGEQLYRELAVFVAENFEHMEVEERHNNAVLWAGYRDDQIIAIEQRLIASLPPPVLDQCLHWMLPYATPGQRLGLLTAIRAGAPAEVFGGLLERLRTQLTPRDWQQLQGGLAQAA